MKFYSDPNSIPLRFHRFFHYIGLPLQTVVLAAQFLTLILSRPLQAFSLLYVATRLICTIVCFVGLFHWRPSAWYALCCSYALRTIEYAVATIISVVNDLGTRVTQTYAQQLVGILIASIVVLYYYYKRRELFFPPAKPFAPATWMDDNPKPESPKPTHELEASVPPESNPATEPVKTVVESNVSEPVPISSVQPVPPVSTTPPTPSTTVPPAAPASTATPTPVTSPDVNFQSPTVKIHRRPSISTILCVILAICCVGIETFFAISINSYQEQLDDKAEQISELQKENHDLRQQNTLKDVKLETANNLLLEAEDAMGTAWLYNKSAVCCPTDGSYLYHRATCDMLLSVDNYYIYNIELAESRGYSPCLICSESNIDSVFSEYMQYIIQLKSTS